MRHCGSHNDILAYERFTATDKFRIALNLTHEARRMERAEGKVVLSTHLDRSDQPVPRSLVLRPDEGVMIRNALIEMAGASRRAEPGLPAIGIRGELRRLAAAIHRLELVHILLGLLQMERHLQPHEGRDPADKRCTVGRLGVPER